MPILVKTFYRDLELVSDEKQQSYLTRGIHLVPDLGVM